MSYFWLGLVILLSVPAIVVLAMSAIYLYVRFNFMDSLQRIFTEKPLFIIPRGSPRDKAEDVRIPTTDGLILHGCYLKTEQTRKGVILFGLEYGSNRWSCLPYCEHLLNNGYDVFAVEPRNQGDSDGTEGYEPTQWLTTYEVADTRSAIAYLKNRPDADPKGLGFFGISKGANAGLVAAASDQSIRCIVTDGAFGTYTTMVPYMRKWVAIYNDSYLTHGLLPAWFYSAVARVGVRKVERRLGVHFNHAERYMSRLKRPLLMIHGGSDGYIKPEMARELFNRAAGPKSFWVVPGAKHNQALNLAGEQYALRVCEFFDLHLGGIEPAMIREDATNDNPTLFASTEVAPA